MSTALCTRLQHTAKVSTLLLVYDLAHCDDLFEGYCPPATPSTSDQGYGTGKSYKHERLYHPIQHFSSVFWRYWAQLGLTSKVRLFWPYQLLVVIITYSISRRTTYASPFPLL
jgi:hypothetical protein